MSEEFWEYHPGIATEWHLSKLTTKHTNKSIFDALWGTVNKLCERYPIMMYDKIFLSKRRSCVFKMTNRGDTEYTVLQEYSPPLLIRRIWRRLYAFTGIQFDYVLVHIYQNGEDHISWHNDKEALDTPIASLSFGAKRKFRFRDINETKGWCAEYELQNGDLVLMKAGCQRKYKHCVPATKTCTEPRINLTFRCY